MLEKERNTKLAKERKKLLGGLSRAIRSKRVLQAMERVPREQFVPPEHRDMAYLDVALTIGEGQTISQPYIVAMMTESLRLQSRDRVLEVGTGSGYQAAILAELIPESYLVTVELVPILRERARRVLSGLGYANIVVEPAGETLGCPERGPYDAIVVTAAAPSLPPSLLEQLAPAEEWCYRWGAWSSRNWCRFSAPVKAFRFGCSALAVSFRYWDPKVFPRPTKSSSRC